MFTWRGVAVQINERTTCNIQCCLSTIHQGIPTLYTHRNHLHTASNKTVHSFIKHNNQTSSKWFCVDFQLVGEIILLSSGIMFSGPSPVHLEFYNVLKNGKIELKGEIYIFFSMD